MSMKTLYRGAKGRFISPGTPVAVAATVLVTPEKKVEKVKVNLTVNLPNGVKLEGPKEVVLDSAKKMGYALGDLFPPTEYYESSTKGLVRISEMATDHLKNAFVKNITPWLKGLVKSERTGRNFVDAFSTKKGIGSHTNLVAMLHELNKRTVHEADRKL